MDNFEKACSALEELKNELIIIYPTPRHWLDRLLNRFGWWRKPEEIILPGGTNYILTQTTYANPFLDSEEEYKRYQVIKTDGSQFKEVLGKGLAVKPSVAKRKKIK